MGNRLYSAAVVVAWLAAMSWLVTARILPPFFRGEPPVNGSLRQVEPVGWGVLLDDRPCGHAVLQAVESEVGVTEVFSWLRLESLTPPKGAPIWITPLVETLGDLSLEIHTRAGFSPMGKLSSFDTKLDTGVDDLPVLITGRVLTGELRLKIRVGEVSKRFVHAWPTDGLLADELLPESKLMPIYPGRRWQKEVYSPFAAANQPVELLQAVVLDETRRITFEGDSLDARVIEYRTAERPGVSDDERLRATLYVAMDGRVVRQETNFLGSRLTFHRLGVDASAQLAEEELKLASNAASGG